MSTAGRLQRRRLDDILVDEGLASKEDVQEALNIQNATGETLGEILVDMGCVTAPDLSKLICMHYALPFISLQTYNFDPKLLKLFRPEFLHQHKILPFDSIGDMLLCAVMEIPSGKVLSEIPKITKHKVALFVSYKDQIEKILGEHCALGENSELLKRRRAAQPGGGQGQAASGDEETPQKVFSEKESKEFLEALDSTWESIFDAVAENEKTEDS